MFHALNKSAYKTFRAKDYTRRSESKHEANTTVVVTCALTEAKKNRRSKTQTNEKINIPNLELAWVFYVEHEDLNDQSVQTTNLAANTATAKPNTHTAACIYHVTRIKTTTLTTTNPNIREGNSTGLGLGLLNHPRDKPLKKAVPEKFIFGKTEITIMQISSKEIQTHKTNVRPRFA